MKRRRINKAKRFDSRCRNHGSCPHCRRSRLYQANREIERFEQKLMEEEPTAHFPAGCRYVSRSRLNRRFP